MKKKIMAIAAVVVLILLLGINIGQNYRQLQIREEIIYSDKLENISDNFLVAWFSDLYYSNDDNLMLNKLISTLESSNPDIILFTGDILENNSISPENKLSLIDSLSSVRPKYGKFAVLGDNDNANSISAELSKEILEESGFEIIDNVNRTIALSNGVKINIIGLSNSINSGIDTEQAFSGINEANFSIVISHCPDNYSEINNSPFDLMYSGHSLGGKVRIPFVSFFLAEDGCKHFYHGIINNNGKLLDITNGVGTPGRKMRFLADPEVVFYSLRGAK